MKIRFVSAVSLLLLSAAVGAARGSENSSPVELHSALVDELGQLIDDLEQNSRPDSRDETSRIRLRLQLVDNRLMRMQAGTDDELRALLGRLDDRLRNLERAASKGARWVPPSKNGDGGISGTVVDENSGDPLPGVGVEVYDVNGYFAASTSTDFLGAYAVEDRLDAGFYYVAAGIDSPHRAELYDGVPCLLNCEPTDGAQIQVSAMTVTTGIDFVLTLGGSISGTATATSSGEPIPHDVLITLWKGPEIQVVGQFVDHLGRFDITGLDAGSYLLTANSFIEYRDELYDDIPCPGILCDLAVGTEIEVTLEEATEEIDFALDVLGSIAGTVTDAVNGLPIPFITVYASDLESHVGSGFTDHSGGHYTIGGLEPGTYFVSTNTNDDYLNEIYDDIPCPQSSCEPSLGTAVTASLNAVTEGIDFSLERLAVISGRVTAAASGLPLADFNIEVENATTGQFEASAWTDNAGNFEARNLFPGSYSLLAARFDYQPELFEEIPCPDATCDRSSATLIEVSLNSTTTNVDFTPDRLGSISGTLADAITGDPVPYGNVDQFDDQGQQIYPSGFSDELGRYTIEAITPGTRYVRTSVGFGYLDELYDGIPCASEQCDPTTGTALEIDFESVVTGIDFDLTPVFPMPCYEVGNALCLNDYRFRVKANWRDFLGNSGSAEAVRLTDDTGYFWFFGPDNVEVIVKVLDACALPGFNSFWVFGAGLTDVEVELIVTDTVTGEMQAYSNALGVPFQPIRDVAAFPTCSAGSVATGWSQKQPEPTQSELPLKTQSPPPTAKLEGTCFFTDTTLCLGESARFEVTVEWKTPLGEVGEGQAQQLTDDTGYFWFFSYDNVEIVVKVLDACSFPPFNNFWVFAAGLTDVEVTVRMRDTESGEVKEYSSFQGQPFPPITDTSAFDTCP